MKATYSVDQQSFGKFTEVKLSNKSNGSYISIIPDFGSVINQISLFGNGTLHELLIGASSYDQLINDAMWYRGAKLLPFPNRIDKGKYEFNGKTYELSINESSRQNASHGFVFGKPFNVFSTKTDENSAKLVTSYEAESLIEGYPFKYSAKVTYELNDKGFKCTTNLTNIDGKDLPIGEGVHPYFKTGSKVDGWVVTFPKCEMLEVNERQIPTLNMHSFDKYDKSTQFGDQKLDNCFAIKSSSDIATIEIIDQEKGIKLSVWQEAGPKKYNFVQIYTPDDRTSMAIEPMTCAPDAFNNKLGLIVLKPGESAEFSWRVTLSEVNK